MGTILSKIRSFLIILGSRLFAGPYLPDALIRVAILLAATDLSLTLIGQSPLNWLDYKQSIARLALPILIGLIYLAAVWVILKLVTRSMAFVVWLPISSLHLYDSILWISRVLTSDVPPGRSSLFEPEAGRLALAAFVLGILLVFFLMRQQTASPRWKWPARVFFVLWGAILIAGIAFSAFYPWSGWQPINPEHSPGPRALTAIAYDKARSTAVLFGGVSDWLGYSFYFRNDTWEWDGHDWSEIHSKNSPPARGAQAMAYDEKRGAVVMFGGLSRDGSMLADTWLWDGKNWEQVYTQNTPPARRSPLLFYDPQREKVILAGGYDLLGSDKKFYGYDDVWEWDGKNWSLVSPGTVDLSTNNPGVAYDTVGQRALVMNYDGVWVWKDLQWTSFVSNGAPPSRIDSWMAADPLGNILLFGGSADNAPRKDTWLLKGDAWTELHPLLSPPARYGQVIFYDAARQSFVMYGGFLSMDPATSIKGDMWEFTMP